jgi:molybdopterin-guanine dinucleotide biosynthesis protein A
MGKDKASLCLGGIPLWQRQLATLGALSPAECFIAGRCDGPYAQSEWEIVPDEKSGCGPLGGVIVALRRARHEHILILAVDLPQMSSLFLRKLVGRALRDNRGAVVQLDNRFEALAAIYPRRSLELAEEQLRTGDFSMQRFVAAAIDAKLVDVVQFDDRNRRYFFNVNTASDWEIVTGNFSAPSDR